MANGTHSNASGSRPNNGEPKPAPGSGENATARRDLASWWKTFKRGTGRPESKENTAPPGIFGVPLQTSIRYANVAISLYNDDGKSYIYGYVPIVVAKCGVFLKEKATDVEGIFRLAGAEKRIKELRATFDSPDRYGKGLDWTGYTVHDAANILRRYFNQLPEPIIPLDFYERFRDPLRNHQAQAVGPMDAQAPDVGDFDAEAAIERYKQLITELPPLNRQLLLYILDLLAVFASKSDLNKMTTPNLAAIFQPGLLSHPTHDMAPPEYRLSQDVLIFLIENQDSFLIGMKGTAADEETVREVQSGAPTPKTPSSPGPGRSKTTVARSGSNASAGAESVRKFGGIRRNVSVSSRGSKQSLGSPGPVTPSYANNSSSSGVHRSNTLPSKKSPAVSGSRFPRDGRERPSDPPTPVTGGPGAPPVSAQPDLQTSEADAPSAIETSQPAESAVLSPPDERSIPATVGAPATHLALPQEKALKIDSSVDLQSTNPTVPPAVQRNSSATPSAASTNTPARTFTSMFNRSPTTEGEKKEIRKPNKLQKKRIPGSANHSAHSSSHSLHGVEGEHPMSPVGSSAALLQGDPIKEQQATSETSHVPHHPTGANLKPTISPTNSFNSHSSVTDYSEHDFGAESGARPDREHRKRRWRLGSPSRRRDKESKDLSSEQAALAGQEHKSTTSVGSSSRALQAMNVDTMAGPTAEAQATPTHPTHTSSEPAGKDPEKKGPIDWFRGKLQERREREEEKAREKKDRGKTPPRSELANPRHSLGQVPDGMRGDNRGRSMDVARKDEAAAS
ncbi:MAG: hypothetical protein M1821_006284 [Bathelium mastoideum]|nr:MAG: hypothetical protein M1821_006284 [Bathelium mastoideum]KAI9686624.1 MAG: hypothetical protein M1822_003635 [Bathelium mastoideum]